MSQLSTPLQELIQAANDLQADKYFSASTGVLVFYDYILTFEDEVRYAWGGRKTWIFYLFILNRYLPMAYKIWMMIEDYLPDYAEQSDSCSQLAVLQPVFFLWSTLLAQIFLMLRIYALSGKNKFILGGFSLFTIIQALTGILLTTVPHSSIVKLPLIASILKVCVFNVKTLYEIAYSSMSLLYDTMAFISIVCLSLRGMARLSTIVRTIVEDATVYFLVIFTSHTILTFFIIFARESLKLTPAIGNNILIPLMVTRLILSLRKASDPRMMAQWNVDHFSGVLAFATATATGSHPTPSDMQNLATRHVPEIEVMGSVFELLDLGSHDKGHPEVSDGEV